VLLGDVLAVVREPVSVSVSFVHDAKLVDVPGYDDDAHDNGDDDRAALVPRRAVHLLQPHRVVKRSASDTTIAP